VLRPSVDMAFGARWFTSGGFFNPTRNGPSVAYSTHAQEIALIGGDHLPHSLDVRSAMQLGS
jgi:hypothetical protein